MAVMTVSVWTEMVATHLFWTVDFGPELQEPHDDLVKQTTTIHLLVTGVSSLCHQTCGQCNTSTNQNHAPFSYWSLQSLSPNL